MSVAEKSLFELAVSRATNYLEFGSGGSTCYASTRLSGRIVTVDSSTEWLANVAKWCADVGGREARTIHADIGPTGKWGYPTDPETRERWPAYHAKVWESEDAAAFDTFMVDGRFRVACCLQILLRCRPDAQIMIHDFGSRAQYHVVRQFADTVEEAEDLTVFRPWSRLNRKRLKAALQEHQYDPK
jgi:hypothetical protein